MAIEIAELQTLLSLDASDFDSGLVTAQTRLNKFAETEFKSAKLELDVSAAESALKQIRGQWETLQREMAGGMAGGMVGGMAGGTVKIAAPLMPTATGALTIPGSPVRVSTVKPERIAATTAATLEQITRTSAAKTEAIEAASAAKIQATRLQATTRTQGETERIEATGAAKREQISIEAEERKTRRLAQIQEEALLRQQMREDAAAKKPLPTRPLPTRQQNLRRTAAGLERAGQQDFQSGAILSATVTAPLVGAAGLVTKLGMGWEDAFTGVTKTVDGTTEQLNKLEHQLRSMAAGANPIPIKVEELSQIAEAAGQLGIQTPAIAGFTRVMADLGQTTNLSSGQAADQLARFANILQIPQDQFDRIGSTIVDLGNKTAATESEIVDMGERLAGAGHQVGMSAEEILSFSAALASVGIEAEAGGTAFSTVFVKIAQSVREGGKHLDLYAKTAGVSVAQFKKLFATDAAQAVVAFTSGLGRINQAGGNVFGTLEKLELGDRRVRDALLRAAGAGDLFATSLKTGATAWRENTALTTEAEKRYATTSSGLGILTNKLREQGIEVSEKLLPLVNKLVSQYGDTLPNAIKNSVDAFAGLPSGVQQSLILLTSLVALAGPAQLLTGNVKLLASSFVTLWAAAAANPVAAVAAVALVTAGYLLFSDAIGKVSQAQNEVKANTAALEVAFKRMLEVLPQGGKSAVEIAKIRDEISAAGTDVDKLNQAAQDLGQVKARLNVEIKNPDLRLVMSDELQKSQSLLDKQKLVAEVIVKPITEKVGDAVRDMGNTLGRRVLPGLYDDGFGLQTDPSKTWVYNVLKHPIDWVQGYGWDGESGGPGGSDDPLAHVARLRGSFVTQNRREQARQLSGALPTFGPPSPLLASFMRPVEAAYYRLQHRDPAPVTPTVTPIGKPFMGVPVGKAEKAESDFTKKDVLEKQQAARNRALERWRTLQAQALSESAQQWGALNNLIEGVAGHMDSFDNKTETARVQARLLKDEFSGIPAPIRAAVSELAAVVDQLENLQKTRDGLREQNNSTLFQLLKSGADPRGFMAAVKAQEAAYNFGPRITNAQNRATSLATSLAGRAAGEEQTRRDKATELGTANSLLTGGGAGVQAESKKIEDAIKDVHKHLPKFAQTCAWAVSEVYKGLGVSLETANNNSAKSLVDNARRNNWRQVPADLAPPGALLAEPSHSANSGWHVTLSTGGRSRAGSNRRAPQFGRAGKDALAFVPPELEAPAQFSVSAPRQSPSATFVPTVPTVPTVALKGAFSGGVLGGPIDLEQQRLLTMSRQMMAGWGGFVNERQQPGVSTQYRMAAQDNIWKRLDEGKTVTAGQMTADRTAANAADFAQSRTDATQNATKATNDFIGAEDRKIAILREAQKTFDDSGGSVAAYERALFEAQQRDEIWNSTDIVALRSQRRKAEAIKDTVAQVKKALEGYDQKKTIEGHQADVGATKEQTDALALLNKQRDYLGAHAGEPEEITARGLELLNGRQAEYNRLLSTNKTEEEANQLADQWAQQQCLVLGLQDRIRLQQQLNAESRQRGLEIDDLKEENRLLQENGNRRERDRNAAISRAETAKRRELADAVKDGKITAPEVDDEIFNAREDAASKFDWEANNRDLEGNRSSQQAHVDQMSILARQRGLIGQYQTNDPELQIKIRLLEKEVELRSETANLTKEQADQKLADYEAESRAQSQIALLSQSRQNAEQAVNNTLEAQKQLELASAKTATERVAIEERFAALLDARSSVPVSDAEKDERKKQGEIGIKSEQLEQAKNAAGQLRDLMSNSLEQGARDGVAGAVRQWVHGLAEMAEKAGLQRLSSGLINKLFGAQLLDESGQGDIYDVAQKRKAGLPATPGISGAAGRQYAGLDSLPGLVPGMLRQRRGAEISPEIDTNPTQNRGGGLSGLAAALGLGDGGAAGTGARISTATIHIERATEHIENATIHTRGTANSGFHSGSFPSGDQIADGVLGMLA